MSVSKKVAASLSIWATEPGSPRSTSLRQFGPTISVPHQQRQEVVESGAYPDGAANLMQADVRRSEGRRAGDVHRRWLDQRQAV